MRRNALVVFAVATLMLTGSNAAVAAVSSSISVKYNQTTEFFHGAVRSSNAECEAGRIVKLYKLTSSGRSLQGRDRTNKRGVWRVEVMNPHGKYVAAAHKMSAMHVTCARARSRTLDVM